MIPISEIRIGNIVEGDMGLFPADVSGPWVIDNILDKTVSLKSIDGKFYKGVLFENIRPIQITSELLIEQLGFTRKSAPYVLFGFQLCVNNDSYLRISSYGDTFTLRTGIDWQEVEPSRPFNYLHQLQNIFYDLTGQDLKFMRDLKK